ncbi:MAG: hypothetical protein AUJ28_01045 [Parcubacteria group bacterium CG1_02_37_51]|uniref:Uncharacterized protein n=2 Tax=Candidatus Komeiliibacteriota TaxID=1817908 RepID=A0A2M8DRR6_9BACT|nr:MAG: hypothetical protein AUJ28_01045 [Parcubacteria group bacterium CG1_02_37_51]PIY95424.1 MAG: hypothetical protein COY67_00035 [Candidatus Komeilibacteria bacterium CG_4_10_14_0_8_um_filter_37_78]PJC02036.1 MAG: hypothetical protein CO073_01570 [Candidatus Komeilibacteria bacterium CG_4_9_14_0_8_um_filter_36_9]
MDDKNVQLSQHNFYLLGYLTIAVLWSMLQFIAVFVGILWLTLNLSNLPTLSYNSAIVSNKIITKHDLNEELFVELDKPWEKLPTRFMPGVKCGTNNYIWKREV